MMPHSIENGKPYLAPIYFGIWHDIHNFENLLLEFLTKNNKKNIVAKNI